MNDFFMTMQTLNLPAANLKTRVDGAKAMIFDPFRKLWVRLTPEEWVRQNFLAWLRDGLQYPASLTAVETHLFYNQKSKRADAVIYTNTLQPVMIIECKAPGVAISQKTLEQAAIYNSVFNTRFVVLTNGLSHFCCKIDHSLKKISFLGEIPDYSTVCATN